MQPISSFLPSLLPAPDRELLSARLRTSDVSLIKASTETHADLTVLTAGGDRVTLSAEALLRTSYTSMNSQSTDQHLKVSLHGKASEVQGSKSIAVSVKGDLDEQEEADLQRLLVKLDKVVNQFLRGDLEGAMSKVLKLDDLGTVAAFQLNVQETQQIAITHKQSISAYGTHALEPQGPGSEVQPSLMNQILKSISDTNIAAEKLLKHLQVLRPVFEKLDAGLSEHILTELAAALKTSLKALPLLLDPEIPEIGPTYLNRQRAGLAQP